MQVAVSILREKDVPPDLKGWATAILNRYSAVPFGQEVRKKLDSGEILLPKASGYGLRGFGAGAFGGLFQPSPEGKLNIDPDFLKEYLKTHPLPTLGTLAPGFSGTLPPTPPPTATQPPPALGSP